ncbi:MAG: FtsW/RodA/SpoVE family cell cycle protein, partial [Oscillatoriales cyanobacterium SM2_1_8]|nr:FtsW/RodA/SpoVE family cell cycle protein [Oscillatoriales cyanobacterium SM2_1_8]
MTATKQANMEVWRSPWSGWQREWRDADWLLLGLPAGLTVWGALAIRSVQHNLPWSDWGQHLLTGAVGLGLALMLARFPYDRWQRYHWPLYGLANLLLVAVLFIGTTALGAQRWIPVFGFNVQPSEFAKFSLVLSLAAVLQGQPVRHPIDLIRVVPVLILPCFLVLLQPNLGTTLVFVAIAVGMLYWAGAKLGWLILLISPLIST